MELAINLRKLQNSLNLKRRKTNEKNIIDEEIEKHLLKAEDDIENGRVRDAEDVFKEWSEKYGI